MAKPTPVFACARARTHTHTHTHTPCWTLRLLTLVKKAKLQGSLWSGLHLLIPCPASALQHSTFLSASISFFGHTMQHMDLNSLTRDRTHAPCSGSTESQPLDRQVSPLPQLILLWNRDFALSCLCLCPCRSPCQKRSVILCLADLCGPYMSFLAGWPDLPKTTVPPAYSHSILSLPWRGPWDTTQMICQGLRVGPYVPRFWQVVELTIAFWKNKLLLYSQCLQSRFQGYPLTF